MIKKLILIVVIIAGVISGCASPVATPVKEALPPVTEVPTQRVDVIPTASPSPALDTLTYTDSKAGFSIDYPTGWYVEASALQHAEESQAYSIGIASWDIAHSAPPSGKNIIAIPEGGTKIEVAVSKQAMTLEEAVAQQKEAGNGNNILSEKDVTLAGGLRGVELELKGFPGSELVRTLIVSLNGNIIYLSGYGNLKYFESIAYTLRPS